MKYKKKSYNIINKLIKSDKVEQVRCYFCILYLNNEIMVDYNLIIIKKFLV
jgi:hypothetical protein